MYAAREPSPDPGPSGSWQPPAGRVHAAPTTERKGEPVMEYPQRKQTRLPEFAYGAGTWYFITVCTKGRARVLGRVTDSAETVLTPLGKTAERDLLSIGTHHPGAEVQAYVIMPDHVHMILSIACGDPPEKTGITVPRVMNGWKAGVSRAAGFSVWQRSYYEHVIRGPQDMQEIWRYIENNPRQWVLDGKN